MAQFGRILTNQNQFQHAIANNIANNFKDETIRKVGFIGTLQIAPKNEFAYSKFRLFKELLGSPIGQFSAWSKDALNINGMLANVEVIPSDGFLCKGELIETTRYYHIRKINHETLIIDFAKNQCN